MLEHISQTTVKTLASLHETWIPEWGHQASQAHFKIKLPEAGFKKILAGKSTVKTFRHFEIQPYSMSMIILVSFKISAFFKDATKPDLPDCWLTNKKLKLFFCCSYSWLW